MDLGGDEKDPDGQALFWLLGEDCPAAAYRARRELLGQDADKSAAVAWTLRFLPAGWQETKGLWLRHWVSALAECGLAAGDVEDRCWEPIFRALEGFECGCADFMLLRALVMLGFHGDERLQRIFDALPGWQLPDGGFLCLHRVEQHRDTPKSCMKASLHALLCAAECHKRGLALPGTDALLSYFLRRGIFYKSTDQAALVLDGKPGWRSIDSFHPFEPMRVGLHNIVEALCALGWGADPRLREARALLAAKRDASGRYVLDGTPQKSWLPRERVGKASKWVTFYALLSRREAVMPK